MNENVNTVEQEVAQMPEPQMPAPQTMDYDQTVTLTDKFVADMHAALDGFAYTEVNEIFKAVDQLKNAMPINIANEIIRRIASFPYNKVANFMHSFEADQSKYVVLNPVTNNPA